MKSISLIATLLAFATIVTADESTIRFNRDVRPILADKCFRCHGPDASARKAELRLDRRPSLVPKAANVIERISSTDDDRMPPKSSGFQLSATEITTLRKWIESGAKYEKHWAFVSPSKPQLPPVVTKTSVRNPIDRFVLSRLEKAGWTFSSEASLERLIRRVTLDLNGVPPTLDEIDSFLLAASRDPDKAYADLVDRLLASPRFGQRMAVPWLDAARYADTNGYFTDNDRTMWRWRDWVIDALNANMPYDQFTIEQLAGDLLPNATVDQQIASGFNRNHMVNNETGIVEEEFRVEYVVDRVDTTATVWMGLTMGCARCHDHKFDPISQKDFYRFFAYFNNVPERGIGGSQGNVAPLITVPTAEQQSELANLRQQIGAAQMQHNDLTNKLNADLAAWEKLALNRMPPVPTRGLVGHFNLDSDHKSAKAIGPAEFVSGVVGNAVKLNGESSIQIDQAPKFDPDQAFSFGGWINPASAGCIVSKTDDANEMRGFDLTLRKGKAIVNLVHRWNRNAIQVATIDTVKSGEWQHIMVTCDGSNNAQGVKIYVDGVLRNVRVAQDNLTISIANDEPLRLGRRQSSASLKGMIDDVRFYNRQLSAQEVLNLATRQLISAGVDGGSKDKSLRRKIQAYFLENHADDRLSTTAKRLDFLRAEERALIKTMPTAMVMKEQAERRETFVLDRGQYDKPVEKVAPNVPQILRADHGKRKADMDRLDLARWMVEPSHPLTARVAVNRIWQQLFGEGIVKTVDDFGTQGDWPSHPELLDWLAVEFVDSGWDVKHLTRLIVCSATYRQSSKTLPAHLQLDRQNRLLARGTRYRLDAEMLRDNALAISGLMMERVGGASVKIYQPKGIWKDVTYDGNTPFEPSRGESLYRRSLYTFWKRQSPPPTMLMFDAPTRETCVVQRSRTNTPLQALALLNDPIFVEAARHLAERSIKKTKTDRECAERMFRLATGRRAKKFEADVLERMFVRQLNRFRDNRVRAQDLLSVGDSKSDPSMDANRLAAHTAVANVILCLDETISKP